jgi:hypothetical protein
MQSEPTVREKDHGTSSTGRNAGENSSGEGPPRTCREDDGWLTVKDRNGPLGLALGAEGKHIKPCPLGCIRVRRR